MIRCKICGLSRPEDIKAVNVALPDLVGFVFAPSRRQVSIRQAAELAQGLDAAIIRVGVFVDAPVDEVVEAVSAGAAQWLQIHGREDARYLAKLRARLHAVAPQRPVIPIIKAYQAVWGADYLLLDNEIPGSGKARGVSSAELRAQIAEASLPVLLAGGINLANLDAALMFEPWAVDISSGAETDGLKDVAKIAALVARTHAWPSHAESGIAGLKLAGAVPAHDCGAQTRGAGLAYKGKQQHEQQKGKHQ